MYWDAMWSSDLECTSRTERECDPVASVDKQQSASLNMEFMNLASFWSDLK
jgi:hypothetical protein